MTQTVGQTLEPRKPIAIIRLPDLADALHIGRALVAGGITSLEFTLTSGQALQAIAQVRADVGDRALVGAGTVLSAEQARAAIDAGAAFLVTPTLELAVITYGREHSVPVLAGAFTPTEILTAVRHGATFVKVFPARSLGPAFIKDVLAPLPDLKLVPTGGVDLENCGAFLQAGAYAVAVGSNLVDERLIRSKDWSALTEQARRYVVACTAKQ